MVQIANGQQSFHGRACWFSHLVLKEANISVGFTAGVPFANEFHSPFIAIL